MEEQNNSAHFHLQHFQQQRAQRTYGQNGFYEA